ncbi:hypothetical protein [Streptomyces glaucosporus]|uniref:hypothetical protein n=1 Tax=Streptomyces glaucosporus TaxID=284044 RepID=UPI0031CDCE5A
MVRPRPSGPGPGPAAGRGSGRAAPPVQRDAAGLGAAVTAGVPVEAVPARARSRPASAPSAPGGAGRRAGAPQDAGAGPGAAPGVDLDDLARRLLDPMARLLRTELRRGRDRTGRPYDGRR